MKKLHMPSPLFESQSFHSNINKMGAFLLVYSPSFAPKDSISSLKLPLLHKTRTLKPVISFRKKRKRNGSQRLRRFMLQSISIMASNLKILPQPLDLIVEELGNGGGNGGGLGFWRGSGWGWSDGWRRGGKKRNLGFCVILVVCGLSLLFLREVEVPVFCGILGTGSLGFALAEGWTKKSEVVVRNGILGIFCIGVALILGLRMRAKPKKSWVQGLGDCLTWNSLRRSGRRRGKFF